MLLKLSSNVKNQGYNNKLIVPQIDKSIGQYLATLNEIASVGDEWKVTVVLKTEEEISPVAFRGLVSASQGVSVEVEDQAVAVGHAGDVVGQEARAEAVELSEDSFEGAQVPGGLQQLVGVLGVEGKADSGVGEHWDPFDKDSLVWK